MTKHSKLCTGKYFNILGNNNNKMYLYENFQPTDASKSAKSTKRSEKIDDQEINRLLFMIPTVSGFRRLQYILVKQ